MKLSTHLYRVGNDIVAAYLVVTPEGVTIIDAGLSGHWRDLRAELTVAGKTLGDVKGIILTHGDSDHLGFAERLRRHLGIPVYVHHADAARAMGGPKPPNAMQQMRFLPLVEFLTYTLRKGGLRTSWLTRTIDVRDGEVLDLPGSPRIIGLPGHSEGSIAVHVPLADAVFVGDGLTTRNVLTGVTGPQPAPFTDDPEQAIASLQNLLPTEATWVLPGHGAPWKDGITAAVRATAAASTARP